MKYQALRPHFFSVDGWLEGTCGGWWVGWWWWGGWLMVGVVVWVGDGVVGVGGEGWGW